MIDLLSVADSGAPQTTDKLMLVRSAAAYTITFGEVADVLSTWNAGTVGLLGPTLALSAGTLDVVALSAGNLLGNAGTVNAVPTGVSVSALLDAGVGSTQGDILYRSATAWSVLAPGTAGQRLSSGGAGANPSWASDPYVVAGFTPGVLTASQICLFHKFAQAVTFPANFAAALSGATSGLSAMALATGSTAITLQKCPTGTDPSVGGNWTNVGTVTVSAGGHAGAFTTTGTVAFASGDKLRAVGPGTADATFGNFALTLAGDR